MDPQLTRTFARFCGLFFLLFVALTAVAQSPATIGLKCSGTLENKTDGRLKYEPTSVDVLIDPASSTASINGWWGCVSLHDTSACSAASIPIEISGSEFKFFERSEAGGYSSLNSFSINRYTGTFSVNGLTFASPESGANWKMSTYTAKLTCNQSARRF